MVQLRFLSIALAAVLFAGAQPQPQRKVEPTFLRRQIADVAAKPADVTTDTCRYKALFGAGDSEAGIARGVAHFGEMTVAPGGASKPVSYPGEEQVYVIMEGTGQDRKST